MSCSRLKCQPSVFITCGNTAKFPAPWWSCNPRRPLPADGSMLGMVCLNWSLLPVKSSFCSPSPFHKCPSASRPFSHPFQPFPCGISAISIATAHTLFVVELPASPQEAAGPVEDCSSNNDQGCSLGTPSLCPLPPPHLVSPLISPTGNQAVPGGDQQVDRPVQCVPSLLECGCQVPHGPQVRRPAGHRALPLLPGKPEGPEPPI